jgi:hypothetical protein
VNELRCQACCEFELEIADRNDHVDEEGGRRGGTYVPLLDRHCQLLTQVFRTSPRSPLHRAKIIPLTPYQISPQQGELISMIQKTLFRTEHVSIQPSADQQTSYESSYTSPV